jgi:heat shock protein HslJ
MKKIALFAVLFTVVIITSCGSAKGEQPQQILTGKTWQVKSINGTDVSMTESTPYINFGTDNKVSGKGGCNSFSGSYNLNQEGGINMSRLVSTKMACPGLDIEGRFFKALEQANMTKITKDKLVLMDGVKEIMVLTPKPE